VELIFVNAAVKKAPCREAKGDRSWLAKIRPWYGHDYHFHVRITCPPGDSACTPQPPPPESEGCASVDLAYWFTDPVIHAEAHSRVDDLLRNIAPDNPFLRRAAHLELSSGNLRGGNDLKIGDWHEVPDFQFTLANNGQGWRLDTTNPDHPPSAFTQHDGRSACKRQIVDLVCLPARDSGSVKVGIFGIWFSALERFTDGLRVLRREQHPQYAASEIIMLENFLADQLTFAVAVVASQTCSAVRKASRMAFSLAALLPPTAGRVP
jgi:hypothetical protein